MRMRTVRQPVARQRRRMDGQTSNMLSSLLSAPDAHNAMGTNFGPTHATFVGGSPKMIANDGSSSNNLPSSIVAGAVAAGLAIVSSLGYYVAYKAMQENDRLRQELMDRVKSKIQLTDADCTQQQSTSRSNAKSLLQGECWPIVFHPIGTITSPFPQRAGTPRQGLLAPHSRSFLYLSIDIPYEVVDGLQQYSHVWIIFKFHLNAVGKARDGRARRVLDAPETTSGEGDCRIGDRCNQCGVSTGTAQRSAFPQKIRPPRANGVKVGCLASRSPHRPNDIGLSLAKIENITTEPYVAGSSGKKTRRTVISLLGLDLVDGTPVLDVKPYVPWDNIGIVQSDLTLDSQRIATVSASIGNKTNGAEQPVGTGQIRVPSWVANDDELSEVKWSDQAENTVRKARQTGELAPLYPPLSKKERKKREMAKRKCGFSNADTNDEAIKAISEVVAQDPRSIHEGRGQASNSVFEITFCLLRIGFRVVSDSTGDRTNKSFAEIVSVVLDEGDAAAEPGSYQHSLYLRRQAEKEAAGQGVVLEWANPVREGVETGLFELRRGSIGE